MGIKTFSIDNGTYEKFREFCKKEGYSMSKKVENFMKNEIEKLRSVKSGKNLQGLKSFSSEKKAATEHSFSRYC